MQKEKQFVYDLINEEVGLGRTRSEINIIEGKILQNEPLSTDEAIFEELGLGKISHPNDNIDQNENNNENI